MGVQTESYRYFLVDHAYLCIDAGNAILLDLRSDKYIGLPPIQADQLSKLIKGWPAVLKNDPGTSAIQSTADSLLRTLMERGLVTDKASMGKAATPVACAPPSDEVGPDTWLGSPSATLADVVWFLLSVLKANCRLRLQGVEATVQHVKRRKLRTAAPGGPRREILVRSIFIFAKLRPFFFTSRDKCLLESLALVEFLARKSIYPEWIFAVRSNPFGAHCWLQSDGLVLNDTLDNVQDFTPIMLV